MFVVQVREANILDSSQIKDLSEQLGYNVPETGVRSSLEYLIKDNCHEIFVAEVDSKVVGWIHISLHKSLVIEERAIVLGLVVDRKFRRQGIGRKLMLRAESWAENCGCHGLMLRSNVIREDAHSFYSGIGYENVKSQYVFTRQFKGTL